MKQLILLPLMILLTLQVSLVYAQESKGDLYEGLTRKIPYDRMITPHGVEVSFFKTTHIIFPSSIVYVDLGSSNIVVGKAEGAQNVLRVKSAVQGFEDETNFSVITSDGSFYSFNVVYVKEPEKLNFEMADFTRDGATINRRNNTLSVYLNELGEQPADIVHVVLKNIYDENRKIYKHIGCKKFGLQSLVKSIYSYNNLLYIHLEINNTSNINFNIDHIRFKMVDKKIMKRTAIQETILEPVRAFNFVEVVNNRKVERIVFAFEQFTLIDEKLLSIEILEQNGNRNLEFFVAPEDVNNADLFNSVKIK